MSQMKSFEGREEMYEYLMKFAASDELTKESYLEPNWGVSPEFLIEALVDAQTAEAARWMKPLMFVTGVSMGMIGGALGSMEEPLSWLLF
jgi:hypothetical protein|tara:strand:+ start:122 stop:391 length:270 start_codon:yes stop_codon:yes gene_type:complete